MINKVVLKELGLVNREVPAYLYKYGSLDNISEEKIKAIENGDIWMSYARTLNDPFEGLNFYLDRKKMSECGYTNEHIEGTYENYKMPQNHMLVASFASNDDEHNMLLWAHYANSHRGYRLKYKVVDDTNIYSVKYSKERFDGTILIDSLYRKHHEQMRTRVRIPIEEIERVQLVANYLIKQDIWQYEDEYRVCKSYYEDNMDEMTKVLSQMTPYITGMKANDEMFEELEEKWKALAQPTGKSFKENELGLQLDEIYVGFKCEQIRELEEVAKKRNVKIYKVEPSIDEPTYTLKNELL